MRRVNIGEWLDPIPVGHDSFEDAVKTSDERRIYAKATFAQIRGERIVAAGWSDQHVSFLLDSGRTLKVFDRQNSVTWSLNPTIDDDRLRTGGDRVQTIYNGKPYIWNRSDIVEQMFGYPVILFGFISYLILAVKPDEDLGFFLFDANSDDGIAFHFLKFDFT